MLTWRLLEGNAWAYQVSLYEKHDLCFVTAMFEICPAYVDCGGEINFIDVFDIFTCFYHDVGHHQFAEIILFV